TGRNFQPTSSNNAVSVNVSAAAVTTASETTLGTYVPAMARSGHVSVTTPFGGAISSEYVFVAPAPYSPADVGMAQALLYETPTTATTAATKISLFAFDGLANQRISLEYFN